VRGSRGRHRGRQSQLLTLTTAACHNPPHNHPHNANRTNQQLNRAEAVNRQVTAVLSAPDATSRTAAVANGGSGTVVTSRSTGRAVVIMAGLPELPENRTYEVWLLGPSAPRPTGLLGASGSPVLIEGLGNATQVGITVEPAGGSDQPTSKPIFATKIPA
jgi:anti-sigma-K factor RskA